MKPTKIYLFSLVRSLIALLCIPFCISCNVFAPFNTENSTEDIIEVAQQCEAQGDYNCAVYNYLKLPDSDLKNTKLCLGYMASAGLTLNSIVNTLVNQSNSAYVIGIFAQSLMPWNAARSTNASTAVNYCNAIAGPNATTTGILLQTVSLLVDCAVRMGKTDQFLATSDLLTDSCSTAGPNTGILTALDIAVASTGLATPSQPGMCPNDVQACKTDILSIQSGRLTDGSLSTIQSAYNMIPSALKSQTAIVIPVIRAALRAATPCPNGQSSC
jgi:hypothetical protein